MDKFNFNNETIVITDPCYLIRHVDGYVVDIADWDECSYGSRMDRVGFTKYVVDRNGYGDGSWPVKNIKTGETLGEIWADSGQTGIFLLDDILRYNPMYKNSGFKGAVVLENFTGEIEWSIQMTTIEPPDFIVEASKILNRPIPYEYRTHSVNSGLIIKCNGVCGDTPVEFKVDFNHVTYDFADSDED